MKPHHPHFLEALLALNALYQEALRAAREGAKR
jgi:hypothetical protein